MAQSIKALIGLDPVPLHSFGSVPPIVKSTEVSIGLPLLSIPHVYALATDNEETTIAVERTSREIETRIAFFILFPLE
jgi:hypothetical protein